MKFLHLLLLITPLAASPIQNYWFNGAEISSYTLSQERYGKLHKGHAELIFVTEPFLPAKQVKDESNQPNSIPVLKLNALTTFNTGIYSYRTMTSTFQPLDLPKYPFGLKTTTSIQDWCGHSFQQLNLTKNHWNVRIFSYFENPGDQTLTLPKTHHEDALWLTLRLNPQKLPSGPTQIIPGSIFTRFHHHKTKPHRANAHLESNGTTSNYTLSYPSLQRTLTIQFSTAFPHEILGWTEKNSTGTTTATRRSHIKNSYYWDLNHPRHTSQRKKLGLNPLPN